MIWLDDETFSPEPIANGTHRYAESAEILIRALAVGDDPVIVRDLTPGGEDWMLDGDDLVPAPLWHLADIEQELDEPDGEVWAHNAAFDKTIERHAGLDVAAHRWRDTMVQAMAHSLPGKLEQLCAALKVPTDKAKDKAGKALIRLFCVPQRFKFRKRASGESKQDFERSKATAAEAWTGRATRDTHPEEWRRFLIYAGQDIIAMRECHKRMPKWNYPARADELALWQLDQRINDRGVAIDLDLADAAVEAVAIAQAELKESAAEATDGRVLSTTQNKVLLGYIAEEYGVILDDLKKANLQRLLEDPDLPLGMRELVTIRLQASATSTTKYKVLSRCASSDGRLRGLLQFCGAARTGRWAGRLFQPQNLPRATYKQSDIDFGIEAMKEGVAHLFFDNVMSLTSSAIRGCLVAPPGRRMVVADLSNIEGRVCAWLAGETWKLKAFEDFDAGQGPDLYKLSYAKSFGVDPFEVTKDQRQIGKVQELMLQYEGGVGAFMTGAATYRIDLEVMAEKAFRSIPQHVMAQANIMFEWHRDKKKKDPAAATGLSKRAWLVCESFKLAWREAHPSIKQFWKDIDNAMRQAIDTPGKTIQCRMLKVRRDGAWLRLGMPSGRALCYPSPEIVDGTITYMGVHQYSRKWARLSTYGGKACENLCQAIARDVMAANMAAVEAAGYGITLSVHDELITEAPDRDEFNAGHLSSILATVPDWAPGLPLAAAGFEAYRYKKD